MNKKIKISKYVITFALTILGIFIMLVVSQFMLYLSVKDGISFEREEPRTVTKKMKENYGSLIEQYKAEEKQNPQDYSVNMRIAQLYIQSEDEENAEIEYKKAIEKSSGQYYEPIFKLAQLYLERNQYDSAEALVEGAQNLSAKGLLRLKHNFYKLYADKKYENGKYQEALDAYNKTIAYRYKLNRRADMSDIIDNLIDTYIQLSLRAVAANDLDNAINYINSALDYRKDMKLYYELSVLYMNKDLEKSAQYFEKVRQADPTLVNFDLYEKVLKDLQKNAELAGNSDVAEIYGVRIRGLKRYVQMNFADKSEFEVIYRSSGAKKNFFTGKTTITIEFQLKNISPEPIGNLFMNIDILDFDKVIFESKYDVSDVKNKLEPNKTTSIYRISTKIPKSKEHDIKLNIYLTKNKQIPMVLVSSQNIELKK